MWFHCKSHGSRMLQYVQCVDFKKLQNFVHKLKLLSLVTMVSTWETWSVAFIDIILYKIFQGLVYRLDNTKYYQVYGRVDQKEKVFLFSDKP